MLRSALVGFALHNGSAPNSVMVMAAVVSDRKGRRAMPAPPALSDTGDAMFVDGTML